jgi:20S proteasome alpha/beta subunit
LGGRSYVCLPLLRKAGNNLSRDQAKKVLEDCLRVLFYRNTKASTRIQVSPMRLLNSPCSIMSVSQCL